MTAPETVALAQYERKTEDYVYQMIEKDITEGYPLINDKIYGTAPKFHFNKQAAAAFAAPFLMRRNFCVQHINFLDTNGVAGTHDS